LSDKKYENAIQSVCREMSLDKNKMLCDYLTKLLIQYNEIDERLSQNQKSTPSNRR
jgi:hypothetical protein